MDLAEKNAPQLAPGEVRPPAESTGLLYLSRIPPFMTPDDLRALLSPHARIGRIYLAPEDARTARRRRKFCKYSRINFVEGWVECLSRAEAKRVAAALNGNIIGGKKSSRWHDDIWNVRYLPNFRWHHLTEQLEYERVRREQRLRVEIAQAKRENKAYMSNVAASKKVEAIASKRLQRDALVSKTKAKPAKQVLAAQSGDGRNRQQETSKPTGLLPKTNVDSSGSQSISTKIEEMSTVRRKFRQRKPVEDLTQSIGDHAADSLRDSKVQDVLSMLFTTSKTR